MKFKLILWTFFLLFSISIVFATPVSPYMVIGTQYIGGGNASNMQVTITSDNGVSVNLVSHKDTGRWMINLRDLNPSLGSSFEVNYCIADTRCREDSQTFIVDGIDKWIEINAELYTGTKIPHLVYGTIKIDGVLQTSGTITVKDITTGITKNYELDIDGFQFNMIDFAYDSGDEVSITYKTYSKTFIVFGDSNIINLVFTSPVSPSPSRDRRGGGGSGPDQQRGIPPSDGMPPDEPDDIDVPKDKPDDKIDKPIEVDSSYGVIATIIALIITFLTAGYYYLFKKKKVI